MEIFMSEIQNTENQLYCKAWYRKNQDVKKEKALNYYYEHREKILLRAKILRDIFKSQIQKQMN
jgi:hypothetical protein